MKNLTDKEIAILIELCSKVSVPVLSEEANLFRNLIVKLQLMRIDEMKEKEQQSTTPIA